MYSGPIVDRDIHHDWPSQDALLPYLSAGWREYATRSGGRQPMPVIPSEIRVERGLLTFGAGTHVAANANLYWAAELARAANDWSIDHWLDGSDDRLYGTALLANQLPEEAARELRRIGGHSRIAAGLLATNGIGKPFGHPLFHPIYAAAEEVGLPIAIHAAGESFASMRVSPVGSGVPSLYLEHHTLIPQGIMTHLVSMIVHGVFEKFPGLRVLLMESGVAWIPAVLWRFDMDFRGLRREAPWLRRAPSELLLRARPGDDAAARDRSQPPPHAPAARARRRRGHPLLLVRLPPLGHGRGGGHRPQHPRGLAPQGLPRQRDGALRLERRLTPVGELERFPQRSMTVVRAGRVELGIVRWDGEQVYALRNVCPHAGGPVCEGRLGPRIVAPAADPLRLEIDDAWALAPGSRLRVRTYPAHVDDGTVLVDLGRA